MTFLLISKQNIIGQGKALASTGCSSRPSLLLLSWTAVFARLGSFDSKSRGQISESHFQVSTMDLNFIVCKMQGIVDAFNEIFRKELTFT